MRVDIVKEVRSRTFIFQEHRTSRHNDRCTRTLIMILTTVNTHAEKNIPSYAIDLNKTFRL